MKKYKTTITAFYEAFSYFMSACIIIILKTEMGILQLLITIQHA